MSDFEILENRLYIIEVSTLNGAITRIFDKIANVEFIKEPRLADNFNILLPLPDTEANYIEGKIQLLSKIEKTSNGIRLYWDGPFINQHGSFGLSVSMQIELVGEGIQFKLFVENNTPYKITEAWYPVIGGIQGMGERKNTRMMVPDTGSSISLDSFNHFKGAVELGTQGPELLKAYPGSMPMPWIDLYDTDLKRGVYFACHDSFARAKAIRLAMHPGIAHCRQDTWPDETEMEEDTPVGVTMNWVCFPYTGRGENFESPPVTLVFHNGDWHNAADIYRKWFTSTFTMTNPQSSWIHNEMAFQNTMLLLPEGNVLWKYNDIPKLAADALEYGVKSFLISGWDMGGHDNMYPFYEPDPRLGTWEELENNVKICHEMGVRVFFFVNLQPVDCTTEWYKNELCRYEGTDPWGCSQPYGFGMGTAGARLQFTRRPMVKLIPSFRKFRDIIVQQMKKLAEIGADGLHFDKLAWGPALMFNKEADISPDRANWEGILAACGEVLTECRAVNPEFCISFEGAWDRMAEFSDVVWMWHSTWEKDHVPVLKYTFSQWIPCLSISQPYDYNIVNNAMRYGYQMFIGPAHYTSSMEYKPMRALSEYIGEALRIREILKDTIYTGKFLDTLQVKVTGHDDVKFNTHLNPQNGERACVLVNFGDCAHEVTVNFDGKTDGSACLYEPYKEAKKMSIPATFTIPVKRFVVLKEC